MTVKQQIEMQNYIDRLESTMSYYERNSEGYNVYRGKIITIQDILHLMGKYLAHTDGKAVIKNYKV